MNIKFLLGASLVLNAVLGGAEFYLLNEDDGDLEHSGAGGYLHRSH